MKNINGLLLKVQNSSLYIPCTTAGNQLNVLPEVTGHQNSLEFQCVATETQEGGAAGSVTQQKITGCIIKNIHSMQP